MAERLVVSTECPTCGAPLDFREGTNALRCAHCRTSLLVTGRGRVLTYFVAPRVDGRLAVSLARFAEPASGAPFHAGHPRLHLVPYYRFTGQELGWEKVRVRRDDGDPPMRSTSVEVSIGIEFVSVRTTPDEPTVELRERWLEKNFTAIDAPALGVYSLGVRPAVLRLGLFRRSSVPTDAVVVAPTLDVAAAEEVGLKAPGVERLVHREILARVLSLVYFPFWLVPIERAGRTTVTVVDAVSRSLVGRGIEPRALAALERALAADPDVAGFRPLVCPNCGWDLPVAADDVVFCCGSCGRAWRLVGSGLDAIPHERLAVDGVRDGVRLPFWRIDAEAGDRTARFHAPAFRCRRLKILADLTERLSRVGVEAEAEPSAADGELRGCYYDADDGAAMARLVCATPESTPLLPVDGFRATGATLRWLPFVETAGVLRDPFTVTAVPRHLLD